jgi:Mn2+/Fe2+ NRAMP family transporter
VLSERGGWMLIYFRFALILADIVFSLLGFAITINSAILVIAAAAFYGVPDAADAGMHLLSFLPRRCVQV